MKWDEKKKWNENHWNSEMWRNEMRKRKVKTNGNIKGSGSNSTSLPHMGPTMPLKFKFEVLETQKIWSQFLSLKFNFFCFEWWNNTPKTFQTTSFFFFFFCASSVCFGLWIRGDETVLYNSVPLNPNTLSSSYFSRLQLFEYSPRISTISHALHF